LEVPFGVRSGLERIGDGGEVFQYYQPVHGKPLVGGSMARLPSRVFAFYRSYPSLVFLSGEPASEPLDQLIADFSEVLDWSGAGYVLLHRAFFSSAQAAQVEAFLNHHPHLIREGVEGDVVIYRVSD
jgi:hypothetical protein